MKVLAMSPQEFRLAFRTERQCMRFVFSQKYPKGFSCKRCKHTAYRELERRGLWECKSCGYQESAKAGTLFHKSKVTLVSWFAAIYEFTIAKGGIAATELQERLGFGSYQTAWELLHKLRLAMSKRDDNYKLDSSTREEWIELDGAIFGKRSKSHVYVAVEGRVSNGNPKRLARTGFVKAKQVAGFNGDELASFANAHIEQLAYVRTDGGLDIKQGNAAADVVIKQKVMGRDKALQDQWLRLVNRAISNMKASLLGVYHGVSPKYLERYLSEYCYRTNRRHWRQEIQVRLLNACLSTGPVQLAETSG